MNKWMIERERARKVSTTNDRRSTTARDKTPDNARVVHLIDLSEGGGGDGLFADFTEHCAERHA